MWICGTCGIEYRCCKTGLTIHDERYHPDSRHQADMHFCPKCKALHINRATGEYFDSALIPDCTITSVPTIGIAWEPGFAAQIKTGYGLDLKDSFSPSKVV